MQRCFLSAPDAWVAARSGAADSKQSGLLGPAS